MKTMFCLVIALCVLSVEGNEFYVYGKAGQQVKMLCRGPQDKPTQNMDLEWSFNGQMIIKVDGKSGKSQKGSANKDRFRPKGEYLEISSMESGDQGSYTCSMGGTTFTHRLHMVSVSALPSDPVQGADVDLKCQVFGVEPLPSARWIRPDGRQADISASGLIQVKLSDSGVWVCELSRDGQTHRENQTINVQPGMSTLPPPAPGPHDETHPGPNPSTRSPGQAVGVGALLGLGMWVWLAVGAGCLVLVLLVVLLVLVQRRNKRMKRRTRKLKNNRKPLEPNDYCQCDRPASRSQRGPREKPSPAARQQR